MDINLHKYEPIFGSWHIKEKLDQGAEGQIYQLHKVDALGNDCWAALKVISIPTGGESEIRSVLASGVPEEELENYYQGVITTAANEFSILSRLKGNTNIVSYEDHEIIRRDDTFGWDILIRMEQSTPLLEYTLDHELTEDQVIKLGIDICHGLSLCAKQHIIHRDIKPENIFITENGDFKIGDFGIARIIEQTQSSLSRKGTYTYMAPEMFLRDPYTENVDLYSLGLVMYQYLNDGRGPFMPAAPAPIVFEDNESAFTKRMSGHDIPEPAKGSPRLKQIVLKACAFDSKERYQTAAEMLEDLEELRRDGRLAARREKQLASLPRYERRFRKFTACHKKALIACLVLLLAFAGTVCGISIRGVTGIEGIGEETKLLIGDDLEPEYTVKPLWFRETEIAFSSSDKDVFTVDKTGRITATGVGDGILTMEAGDYTENVHILVDPKVTKISGISDLELYEGDTKKLAPKLAPDKYKAEPVTYTSSDKSVATVSDSGKISAKDSGITTIHVAAGGTVKNIDVIVTERPTVAVTRVYSSSGSSSGSSSKASSSKKSSSKKSSSGGSSGGDYFGDDEYF